MGVRLSTFIEGHKAEAVLAPLFKLLEAVFELLVPLAVASLIDLGIANGDIPYILRMALLMVVLALVGLASSVTAQYFSARAATGFAEKMKSALFCHIQSLSEKDRDEIGTSTLITRLTSDATLVQNGINMFLHECFVHCITIVAIDHWYCFLKSRIQISDIGNSFSLPQHALHPSQIFVPSLRLRPPRVMPVQLSTPRLRHHAGENRIIPRLMRHHMKLESINAQRESQISLSFHVFRQNIPVSSRRTGCESFGIDNRIFRYMGNRSSQT